MAKLPLALTIAFTLLTAGLGYFTYGKVEGLRKDRDYAKAQVVATQQKLTKAEGDFRDTSEKLSVVTKTMEGREAEAAKQKGEIERLGTELAQATRNFEEKSGELEKWREEIRRIRIDPVPPERLTREMEELMTRLAKAEAERDEARQARDTLTVRVRETEEKLRTAERQLIVWREDSLAPALSGRIIAYNAGYGFAVLDIGDRQGLKANKTMIVKRQNQMVGKVKVRSVEPDTAVADVIPNSGPTGKTLQPGDQVIYEGRR